MLSPSVEVKSLVGCRVIALLNANELFGQEKANIEVFKALGQGGAEVQVGLNAVESGGAVGRFVRELGFATFDIPMGFQWSKQFFWKKPSLVFNNLNYIRRASRVMRNVVSSYQPTHIHLTNPLTYSFVAPALRSKAFKVVYRMGDEPPHRSRANLWIWRACAKRADHLVANSRFVSESILRAYPEAKGKLSLVYNIAPELREETDLPAFSSGDLPPRFLFIGQIAEHKGILHFVDAAMTLAKQNSGVRFDIAGGSQYSQDLEKRVSAKIAAAGLSARIVMHGHVADPTQLYRSATAIVVPSLFEEPAANVVLEAKRHGVPAIVYPSGGLPELVSEGLTGWVCKSKTAAELVERMEELSQNLRFRHETTVNCLRETQDMYGRHRFQSEWQAIYRRVYDGAIET
jgi:glycosyltransferase involved in cell wall biosynthesis